MTFTVRDLKKRKKAIQATLAEAETRFELLEGTESVAECATGTDIVSLRKQLDEIDAALSVLSFEVEPTVPRREPFPASPTVLVDGIPPREGIPADARVIRRSDGSFYYVDSTGRVIPRG